MILMNPRPCWYASKRQMFFVPVGDWFRVERYLWLRDLLLKSELSTLIFKGLEVDLMLKKHHAADANFTRELLALAVWDGVR